MADQTYEPEEEAVLLEAIHLGLPNPCCRQAVWRWVASPEAPDHVRQASALPLYRAVQGLVVASGLDKCDACRHDFTGRLRGLRKRLAGYMAEQAAAEAAAEAAGAPRKLTWAEQQDELIRLRAHNTAMAQAWERVAAAFEAEGPELSTEEALRRVVASLPGAGGGDLGPTQACRALAQGSDVPHEGDAWVHDG